MITVLYLAVSAALLGVLGAGLAAGRSAGPASLLGRCGLAYGLGALALSLEATLFSILRIPWSVAGLGLPLAAASAALLWRGRTAGGDGPAVPLRSTGLSAAAVGAGLLAALHLAVSFATSAANSVDFALFYGVKGVHFAKARSIDLALLGHPFFVHGAPRYPPLVPIVEAWGILVAGAMPWRFASLLSLVWFVAASAAIASRLRRRVGADEGAAVAAFWSAALAMSLAWSFSGGNAEAALVFYLAVGGAWLMTELPGDSRFVAAACLAGAAFTKQEGLLGALALAAGTLLRDRIERRPRTFVSAIPLFAAPLAAVGLWFAWEKSVGLPAGYGTPTDLARLDLAALPSAAAEMLPFLGAGTLGLSWVVPLGFLLAARRSAVRAIPGLIVAAILLAALVATYLGAGTVDRPVAIARTLPRAIQPALALVILSAGVAWFRGPEAGRSAAATP